MISIVGIGTGGSRIAQKFASISQYSIYTLADRPPEAENVNFYQIDNFETPEEYEKNIPDVKNFFKD